MDDMYRVDFFKIEVVAILEAVLIDISNQCRRILDDIEEEDRFGKNFPVQWLDKEIQLLRNPEIIQVPQKVLDNYDAHSGEHEKGKHAFLENLLKYYLLVSNYLGQESLRNFFVLVMVLLGKVPLQKEYLFIDPFDTKKFAHLKYSTLRFQPKILNQIAFILKMIYDQNFNQPIAKSLFDKVYTLATNENLFETIQVCYCISLQFEEMAEFRIM